MSRGLLDSSGNSMPGKPTFSGNLLAAFKRSARAGAQAAAQSLASQLARRFPPLVWQFPLRPNPESLPPVAASTAQTKVK
jgi:hypothetical protein